MRHFVLALVLAGASVAAGQPAEDAVKKERKLFQGKWVAAFAQGPDGKPLTDEELKKTTLVVEGDKFVMTTGDTDKIEGTFKIDPNKKPKTIDVFTADSKDKPIVVGIYEIKGDTRTSCFSELGKDRPDAFRKEKGYLFLEWKRAK